MLRKDLLPLVTKPKAASDMNDLNAALETWETNRRLFESADGKLPDAEQERLAVIGILPGDLSPNVIMEIAKPGFETYAEVRRYVLRLLKVLQHQKRRGRNINLVDAYQQGPTVAEGVDDEGDQQHNDDDAGFKQDLRRYILLGLSPPSKQQR